MKKVDLLRRFIGAGIAESAFASICNANEIKAHIWEMPGVYFQYIDDLYPSSYSHIFEGLCIRQRTAKNILATRSYFIVISLPKDIIWDSSRTRLTAEQIDEEAGGSTLEHILSDLNRGMMETITRMLSEGYVCHPINLESLTKAKHSIIAIGAKGREITDACDLFVSIHLCSKLVGGSCLPSRVLQQVIEHQREKEKKDDKDKRKRKPNKKKKPRRDDDILSVLADKTRKETCRCQTVFHVYLTPPSTRVSMLYLPLNPRKEHAQSRTMVWLMMGDQSFVIEATKRGPSVL